GSAYLQQITVEGGDARPRRTIVSLKSDQANSKWQVSVSDPDELDFVKLYTVTCKYFPLSRLDEALSKGEGGLLDYFKAMEVQRSSLEQTASRIIEHATAAGRAASQRMLDHV